MKAYTNREQSKRLSEILPTDSANMCWVTDEIEPFWGIVEIEQEPDDDFEVIPAWSLAALLRELPDTMLGKDKDGYVIMVETMGSGLTAFASNPVDACYEMILKLHELNLL